MKRLTAPVLLALAFVLLGLAWLVANPPTAAPDEAAHYVKALGAGAGDLRGDPLEPGERAALARAPDADVRWQARTSRRYEVPAGSLSSAFHCNPDRSDLSWACLEQGRDGPLRATEVGAHTGTYKPFVYVPAGVLARIGDGDPETGLLLGRIGMAALALGLLALAVFLLWDAASGLVSLLGVVLAVTPMAVFCASILNSSGPEVGAAVCFGAAVVRVGRGSPPGWTWWALAGSGAVLALSRELGPLFVVLLTVLLAAPLGRREALARLLAGIRARVAWAVVGIAAVVGLAWDSIYQPHPDPGAGGVLSAIPSSIDHLRALLKQTVGTFGSLDSPLPAPAYLAWLALLGLLLVAAWVVSSRRERLALIGTAGAVIGLTVLLGAIHRDTGFVLQGRYVLPAAVAVPLLAGELLRRNRERLDRTLLARLAAAVTAGAGLVQLVAWYANGRRAAVGTDGSWLFPVSGAEWTPLVGWAVPLLLAALAGLAYAAAAASQAGPVFARITGRRLAASES